MQHHAFFKAPKIFEITESPKASIHRNYWLSENIELPKKKRLSENIDLPKKSIIRKYRFAKKSIIRKYRFAEKIDYPKKSICRKNRLSEIIDYPKISIRRKYRLLEFSDPCLVKDYDLSSQWCIQTICDETFHQWLLWWHCSPWFNCWWFAHLTVRNDCSSVTYKIAF